MNRTTVFNYEMTTIIPTKKNIKHILLNNKLNYSKYLPLVLISKNLCTKRQTLSITCTLGQLFSVP